MFKGAAREKGATEKNLLSKLIAVGHPKVRGGEKAGGRDVSPEGAEKRPEKSPATGQRKV